MRFISPNEAVKLLKVSLLRVTFPNSKVIYYYWFFKSKVFRQLFLSKIKKKVADDVSGGKNLL